MLKYLQIIYESLLVILPQIRFCIFTAFTNHNFDLQQMLTVFNLLINAKLYFVSLNWWLTCYILYKCHGSCTLCRFTSKIGSNFEQFCMFIIYWCKTYTWCAYTTFQYIVKKFYVLHTVILLQFIENSIQIKKSIKSSS